MNWKIYKVKIWDQNQGMETQIFVFQAFIWVIDKVYLNKLFAPILIWFCSIDTYAKKNIFNRATRDPGLRKLGFQRFVKSIWEAATKNMEQMAD